MKAVSYAAVAIAAVATLVFANALQPTSREAAVFISAWLLLPYAGLGSGTRPDMSPANWIATLALLAPLVALAGERGCEIPGEKIHWIADYCMAQLETDDEIPASDCIAKENAIAFRSACAAKRHYKKAMCELSISRGTLKEDVARCVADPEYVGATVRNGGVGGR